MADNSAFKQIIEEDLNKLKFILKMKLASLEEIKKEEENIIDNIKKLMVAVKEMEKSLENEIEMFKKISGGWERAYFEKRWEAIGNALKSELENFNNEYKKTKDLYESAGNLAQRLEQFKELLKKLNIKNVESRENDLKMLEDFKKQKEGGYSGNLGEYNL